MDTTYIYAGTRAKTLERNLLTEPQVERLLTAKSVEEVYSVLQDTFLALYLAKEGEDNIVDALDQYIVDARKTLESMAPNKEILDILWLRYDYHNLKTIIKGKKSLHNNEDIKNSCFAGGKYKVDSLIKAFEDATLGHISSHFAAATEKARVASHVFEIDLAMNEFYFKEIKQIEIESKDPFVTEFVTLLIDLFNIKAALRIEHLQNIDFKNIYVAGGSFSVKDLEKEGVALESLRRIGNEKEWVEAISEFEKNNDYTSLEKKADEHITDFLRTKSSEIFSPASLFSYFTVLKHNAQTISAVLVAKRAGISEKELRTILRRI